MKVRRNPDIVGDVVLIGAVLLGMGAILPMINSNAAKQFNQAGYNAGSTVGGGIAGAVSGAVGSIASGNQDLCTAISQWRQLGAPAICWLAWPGLPNICSGGGNPKDWQTFRAYMTNGNFGLADPGAQPPSCF